jgi:DNA processing protein
VSAQTPIKTFDHLSANYPKALFDLQDFPKKIFYQGDLELLQRPLFAVIGSRNASHQGLIDANRFAKALSEHGFCIVSGLALGIDAAAHYGALANGVDGFTLAVCGTGLDIVYPANHLQLAKEIAQRGLLISEFPVGSQPKAFHFPKRNRLIAALSRGVLVIEAGLGSGSLITAHMANELGREVFALPGSIHSPHSKGCHQLIQDGAKLITRIEDILGELPAPKNPLKINVLSDKNQMLGDFQALYRWIDHTPRSLDEICRLSLVSSKEALAQITLLEAENRIECLPGGLFRRLEKSGF